MKENVLKKLSVLTAIFAFTFGVYAQEIEIQNGAQFTVGSGEYVESVLDVSADGTSFLTKAGFLGSVPGVEAGTVKDKGDKYLSQLCEQTGGETFFTGSMIDLEKAFKKISEELRGQYIITYRPANQDYDGRDRKIEVRFTDKEKADKYKIRSKSSYRAVRDSLK